MEKVNYTIIFSAFYILGVISFHMNIVFACAVFLLLITIICLLKNIFSNKTALIFYFAFILAFINCNMQIKNFDDLSQFIPANAKITGQVENIPSVTDTNRAKFYFKVKSVEINNKKYENIKARSIVTLIGDSQELEKVKIADELEINGKLRNPIKSTNPSQFDYGNYLKHHKTFSTFYSNNNDWKVISAPKTFKGKFLQKLNDKRTEILEIHNKYIKSPNIEVLGGIVFGDDAISPPDEIKTSFINSGLLHILAASGMNVSIIFGIWFFVGMKLRLNYRFVVITGAMLVVFYTLMTGMGPSVLRASLMIEFVILGKLINRNADSIALVFFVALLMLLYNPSMINDVGFQLSFVVTFALMFYCPPILGEIKNKYIEFIAGGVLIPVVAQLFAGPIQMFYFNSFATYSVFANFAITPFIMIISFLGFLSSIFAMFPFIADKVCLIFDVILNPIVTILVNISNYFSELPNSLLTTMHPSYIQIILFYTALILLGFGIKNKFKSKKLITTFIILVLLFSSTLIKVPKKNCEIIIFDVGNADSFLIKTPNQKYIIIDTARGRNDGSSFKFSQAETIICKYLKDNGIKELELMIITHFDSDHSGGAVDLMKNFKVKKVLLNKESNDKQNNTLTAKNILNYIKENNIHQEYAKNNSVVFDENKLKIKTFLPNIKDEPSDNDNSTITLLSYGDFDMLFMADGGIRSFERIEKSLNNNKIEVIKTGHHGAKDTVSKAMLRSINPDCAIISTGINIYGHPDKQTLNIIYQNGLKIYRTDIDKAIKIVSDSQNYKVLLYNSDRKIFE